MSREGRNDRSANALEGKENVRYLFFPHGRIAQEPAAPVDRQGNYAAGLSACAVADVPSPSPPWCGF